MDAIIIDIEKRMNEIEDCNQQLLDTMKELEEKSKQLKINNDILEKRIEKLEKDYIEIKKEHDRQRKLIEKLLIFSTDAYTKQAIKSTNKKVNESKLRIVEHKLEILSCKIIELDTKIDGILRKINNLERKLEKTNTHYSFSLVKMPEWEDLVLEKIKQLNFLTRNNSLGTFTRKGKTTRRTFRTKETTRRVKK